MNSWQQSKLGDIARKDRYGMVDGPFGSNLPASEYTDTGVPIVRGVNLSLGQERFRDYNYVFVSDYTANRLKRSLCKPYDIIFTKKGTLGQTGIIPKDTDYNQFLLSSNQMKLSVNNRKADALYVYYYVSSPYSRQRILIDAMTTGVPKINLTYLRNFPILLPPIQVQQKIAAILSAYDDLIENNKRRIALLEKMAEEIYREWFVRMRFPGYEYKLFHKGIPNDWKIKKFRDIVHYYIGGGWGKESQTTEFSDGAYVIRGTDIPRLDIGELSKKIFMFHKHSNLKSRMLEEGDFIFEVSGGSKNQLLGRNLHITNRLLHFYENKVICANFCKLIRFNIKMISPFFMKCYLKLYYETDLVGIYQVQSTGISNYQFESFLSFQSIILPTDELLDRFDNVVRPLDEEKENLAIANFTLKQSRDILLGRLISRKLLVESLDIHFPPSIQNERDVAHA